MCLSTLRGSKGEGRTVPPRYLKVTHWNIEGIFSDVHGNKLDDPDFLNATKNDDLILFPDSTANVCQHYENSQKCRFSIGCRCQVGTRLAKY